MSSDEQNPEPLNHDSPTVARPVNNDFIPAAGKPELVGYDVLDKLGEGGMGAVWRAVQRSTKREVALKFLNDAGMYSEKARARFEREVELAARLEHPHIGRVYDSGVDSGMYYFAMRLVEGVPLNRYVKEKQLSTPEILELMRTISEAVQFAHQRGIIHRDLKPSNIMVAEDGTPQVLDFGLAKDILAEDRDYNLSMEGEVCGTPAFMAPEQARGRPELIGTGCDVYALGAMLYNLLTGQSPHDLSGTDFEVMRSIVEIDIQRPRALKPDIDPEVEAILLKALEKDPKDRYATAAEFADDLGRFLNHDPIHAQPPSTLYFLKKRLRKYRLPVTVAALFLAALIVGTTLYFLSIKSEQKKTDLARIDAETEANNARRAEEVAKRSETEARTAESKAVSAEQLAREAAEDTRVNLYYNRIARAYHELEAGDLRQAHRMLQACPHDLRNWEWFHLSHRCGTPSHNLVGHDQHIRSISISPDGRLIASTANNFRAFVWDAATRRRLAVLESDRKVPMRCSSFRPDGKKLATASSDGTIQIWSLESYELEHSREGHPGEVNTLVWSLDGKHLVSGGKDNMVRIWPADLSQVIHELDHQNQRPTRLLYTHDGAELVVSTGKPGKIWCWNPVSGELNRSFGHAEGGLGFSNIALSPNGIWLASAENGPARIWEFATGAKSYQVLSSRDAGLLSVDFSPDGSRLFTAGWSGTGRIHDWQNDRVVKVVRGVTTGIYSRDGKYIIGEGSHLPQIHALQASRGTRTIPAEIASVSTDGKIMVLAHSEIEDALVIMDTISGESLQQLRATGKVILLALSPDKKWVAAAFRSGEVQVWRIDDAERIAQRDEQTARIWSLQFTHGTPGLVIRKNKTISCWDFEQDEVRWEYAAPHENLKGMAMAPDGSVVATSIKPEQNTSGRSIRLIDVETGTPRAFEVSTPGSVQVFAFHPTEPLLAYNGSEKTIELVDLNTGRRRVALSGHENIVRAIAFNPAGSRMYSLGGQNELGIWDPITGREILIMSSRSLGQVNNRSFALNPLTRELLVPQRSGLLEALISPLPTHAITNGQSIELLDEVDLARDGACGRVVIQADALEVGPHTESQVTFPMILDGDYTLEFNVRFDRGGRQFRLLLPVANRYCQLVYNARKQGVSIVSGIDEYRTVEMKHKIKDPPIEPGQTFQLRVDVKQGETSAEIHSTIDGEPWLSWSGEVIRLSPGIPVGIRSTVHGCATFSCYQSLYVVSQATLTMHTGWALPVEDVLEGFRSLAGPSRDLLAPADPSRDSVVGTWRREGKDVVISGGKGYNRLVLPEAYAGQDYVLQVEFTREEKLGDGSVGFILPVADRQVLLGLDFLNRSVSTLELINGHGAGDEGNPTTIYGERAYLENGHRYRLRVEVLTDGPECEIRVRLDDDTLIHWRGAVSSLDLHENWALPRQNAFGLAAGKCTLRVHGLTLQSWEKTSGGVN